MYICTDITIAIHTYKTTRTTVVALRNEQLNRHVARDNDILCQRTGGSEKSRF